MNAVLDYLKLTDALLCSLPTRERIAKSPKLIVRRTFEVRVDRTMPFEFIANVMPPFCGLWGADVRFNYSDYDAALPQLGGDQQADMYIMWLDWRIYRKSMTAREAADWIMRRIQQLRGGTDKTIGVNNWPESLEPGGMLFSSSVSDRGWIRRLNVELSDRIEKTPGCVLIDVAGLAYEWTGSLYDRRNEELSSYPFSDQATILVARHLAVHLLPAVFHPRLKAIALDLDDTLYSGVLGEDGGDGVILSEGHYELQRLLLRLKHSGMMLTVCSRNEEQDVRALFESRDDFPLKWTDFAAVCANWQPKAENMTLLAQRLNIDPSAFLFIDDNPAELLKMAGALPGVHLLQADSNGSGTMAKISYYPGLYQLHSDKEASSRTADIQANQMRETLRKDANDYASYLKSLQMKITLYVNEPSHAGRLFDLSRKTNQFNLALRRMTEVEAKQAMDTTGYLTITVRLSDLLSDSGIIGAFVCRLEGGKARILETLFSCRALGREIETVSFAVVLDKLVALGVKELGIDTVEGSRNGPAVDWLKRFVTASSEDVSAEYLLSLVKASCMEHPAEVEVIE
ncbi:HAD-IIIC family phosphatase [Paenibacillus abyssi]|uniref:Haloacid dehalogenase n=1 Tax=Paenibacillus abyssi TaxID=1340531 RepID=A0A917CT57_9BACL|nr:HAD-IIIC family phosphatase [Paenibacillus abyssi]GGF98783.1 haloacid dehalogenase [Paenibacillus abyssi]